MGEMGISRMRNLVLCSALAVALTACGAHKKEVKPPKKHNPLVEKIVVNQSGKLNSEFRGGVCNYDVYSRKVTYLGNDGYKSSFEVDDPDMVGEPFALHCSESKTVLITRRNALMVHKGSSDHNTSPFSDDFGSDSLHTSRVDAPAGELFMASAVLDDNVYVLSRNFETGVYSVHVIDFSGGDIRTFGIGNACFENGVVMKEYKGVVFIAGEAEKGKPGIVAMRKENQMFGAIIDAKRDLEGPVSFEENEGILVLKIGNYETEIHVSDSKEDLTGNKTACLGESKFLKCFTLSNP